MKSKKKIPVMATAGAVVTGISLWNSYKNANPADKSASFVWNATGFDTAQGKWLQPKKALATVAPVALGVGASMIFSKIGGNRYISAIPWFKM